MIDFHLTLKNLKNDWNPGLDGFQIFLHPCPLGEIGLSIKRVKNNHKLFEIKIMNVLTQFPIIWYSRKNVLIEIFQI